MLLSQRESFVMVKFFDPEISMIFDISELPESKYAFSKKCMCVLLSVHLPSSNITTIGNFFCSTHGYFEPCFSRETQDKCQSTDRGEVSRHANSPLVSKNYQQDSTHRWWHDDTQKWYFYILRDGSSDRISQGTTRLKVNNFKKILRWFQDVFNNSRWTNSKDGPFGRVRRISPLEDDAILIRFWKRRTILQQTGPLAVCEGSARLKKMPSHSFYLKIVGTTI